MDKRYVFHTREISLRRGILQSLIDGHNILLEHLQLKKTRVDQKTSYNKLLTFRFKIMINLIHNVKSFCYLFLASD